MFASLDQAKRAQLGPHHHLHQACKKTILLKNLVLGLVWKLGKNYVQRNKDEVKWKGMRKQIGFSVLRSLSFLNWVIFSDDLKKETSRIKQKQFGIYRPSIGSQSLKDDITKDKVARFHYRDNLNIRHYTTIIKIVIKMFNILIRKCKTTVPIKKLSFHFSHNICPTVFALSSGINSAISIVRISGHDSYKVLSLTRPKPCLLLHTLSAKQTILSQFKVKPREMMLRSLFSPQKGLIDRCLMVYFEQNRSYSGEDLFQLHLHGSKAVVLAVFQQLSHLGFTPAKRGEFTRRAILNGRMDLLQAEAINDLVQSQLEFQRQIAIGNLMGHGAKYLQELRADLMGLKTLVQSYIEFQEQQVGDAGLAKAKQNAQRIIIQIRKIIEGSKMMQKAKEGVKIAIIGRPNVGKSTLINGLVKKDVAIVSQIPGTTRDLIESSFEVGGYRVDVIDTAGLRESECPIEREGIRRSRVTMQQSQIRMIVLDVSQSQYYISEDEVLVVQPSQEQYALLNQQIGKNFVIINKIDTLPEQQRLKPIKILQKDGALLMPQLCISAKQDHSLKALIQSLGKLINSYYNLYGPTSSAVYFTRQRYLSALEGCFKDLQLFQGSPFADLCSHHLSDAVRRVEELVGRVDNEEVLDQIFSTFCIGK